MTDKQMAYQAFRKIIGDIRRDMINHNRIIDSQNWVVKLPYSVLVALADRVGFNGVDGADVTDIQYCIQLIWHISEKYDEHIYNAKCMDKFVEQLRSMRY